MVFFVLFAVVLIGTYVALRRELASPKFTAMGSVLGSSISLTLFSLTARDTSFIYSVVLGIIAGSIFSGLTLGIAWYFHKQEVESR